MIRKSDWKDGYIEWIDSTTAHISVVFSWHVQKAYQRAVWLNSEGYHVLIGGPAVHIRPDIFHDMDTIGCPNALQHHNPNATFTSRGCIRRCKFCIVPILEGDLKELADWIPKPIVCDNNLLACSMVHFNKVIDKLKPLSKIDFNQGLDARLLTHDHAVRLTELDTYCIRLAWDDTNIESQFRDAVSILNHAGIPCSHIRVYVLIGHEDNPRDALYRLRTVRKLGMLPNPMRYQPIDTMKKNSHVGSNWTKKELSRYMRYWSNIYKVSPIPFEEFYQ